MQTEEMLLDLILNYKEHNGVKNKVSASHIDIPLYIQQLFYHLVNHLCTEEYIQIIPSEYLLLKQSLQNELLSIEPLLLYPFFESLGVKVWNIQGLEQYIWILSEKQLDKLKHGQKYAWVMSGHEYHYKMMNKNNTV
eukprot:204577_1